MKSGKVRDINRGSDKKTVVLRERVFHFNFHFEISRKKIIAFIRDHKRWSIAMCAVLAVGVFARLFMIGFASTADFYPSSCLGSWDNVQNALAGPDLAPGSPASAFTALNSAVFSTGTAQMFCGNFSGKTNIADLQAKQFQSATLVLSWYAALPEASLIGGGTPDAAAVSTSTASSTATDESAASSTSPASSTDASVPDATAPNSAASTTPAGGASPDTSTDSSVTPPPPPPAPADTTPSPVDTIAPPVAPPPDAAPPPPAGSSDASPTSWLSHLFPVAFAENGTSTIVASSAIEDVPSTSTPATSIAVDTSAFQNIALPAGAPGDFLAIVYSTDGVTWQPLVDINASNWQSGRYPIPVASWNELQHLQVAFVGLGATGAPQIYLDSVGIEVGYLDAPDPSAAPSTDAQTATSTVFETATSTAASSTDAGSTSDPLAAVFDPAAGQQCSVSPFSNTAAHPGSASYVLAMSLPSATPAASSIISGAGANDSSTATGERTPISAAAPAPVAPPVLPGPPLYDASLGSLPDGVKGYITMSGTAGVDTIGISVGQDAAPGSYGVVVIYKERQFDGKTLPTFCQFNLVVR